MTQVTKEAVFARLRPQFERAARERSGVSFFLSGEELAVFDQTDLQLFKDETGYTVMLRAPQPSYSPEIA